MIISIFISTFKPIYCVSMCKKAHFNVRHSVVLVSLNNKKGEKFVKNVQKSASFFNFQLNYFLIKKLPESNFS
jgi:hypothetical protein